MRTETDPGLVTCLTCVLCVVSPSTETSFWCKDAENQETGLIYCTQTCDARAFPLDLRFV